MKRLASGIALSVLLWEAGFAGAVSRGPRELGEVTLREWSLQDGKLAIRVDSGGCTNKSAIQAHVRKEPGATSPRYVVTFERVRADDCKAFLLDGVVLEYSLPGDLGIAGPGTVAVANPVLAGPGRATAGENTLKRELVSATVKAIELEMAGYETRLKAAQDGPGSPENVPLFQDRIEEMKRLLAAFRSMDPRDYEMSETPAEPPEPILGDAGYGPVKPAGKMILKVRVNQPCHAGSLLEAEGTTRSGPFFHLAGIAGDAYDRLQPGREYTLTVYLVYRRDYIGFMRDHYVYVAEVN